MRVTLGPADFHDNEMRGYEVGKRAVLIVKKVSGYKALDDWCNHAGCLLSGGRLEKNLVICPCHEVGFDLDTGANKTSPGVCDDQRTFRVTVEDGMLVLQDFNPNP
jgi:3-phenylpropionate/trans-cinnamate dioxygenase ferredoxin subunit